MFVFERLERAEPDMLAHLLAKGTGLRDLLQQARRKMQASRRRGHAGGFLAGKTGLG